MAVTVSLGAELFAVAVATKQITGVFGDDVGLEELVARGAFEAEFVERLAGRSDLLGLIHALVTLAALGRRWHELGLFAGEELAEFRI